MNRKRSCVARSILARVVQVRYPDSVQGTWALRFLIGDKPHYLARYAFNGRSLWGPDDGITVTAETERTALIPYGIAMAAALDELSRAAFAQHVEPFRERYRDLFKNPALVKKRTCL